MAASPEIYFEHAPWGRPIVASVVLHASLAGAIVVYALFFQGARGPMWGSGGSGEAMSATLVSSLPLPTVETQSQSVLATESKGLTQSQPIAQIKEPDAIDIPDKNIKKKVTKAIASTVKPREPERQPSNQVPFGEGGPAHTFSASGGQGSMSFSGGSGDFGSRFGYYVRVVQQKVSENWLKYEVDPTVSEGRRVYVSFDISRGGDPSNIQVEQSSGVPSLDVSAVRALKRIDTFGPLPADYAGNKVSVEFYFDWKK